VHIILRGGSKGPNYSAEHVREYGEKITKAGLFPKIMVSFRNTSHELLFTHHLQIDCSHGNSSKQHSRQTVVGEDIAVQLESGDTGALIMGVMLESNLVEGRQDIPISGPAGLRYGQSVTDACLSWEQTVPILDRLRQGVQGRRKRIFENSRAEPDTTTA
jgi:3-deoxy-7-phosphoheptulonate synthase